MQEKTNAPEKPRPMIGRPWRCVTKCRRRSECARSRIVGPERDCSVNLGTKNFCAYAIFSDGGE